MPFSRHFQVVFDVLVLDLNLSIIRSGSRLRTLYVVLSPLYAVRSPLRSGSIIHGAFVI